MPSVTATIAEFVKKLINDQLGAELPAVRRWTPVQVGAELLLPELTGSEPLATVAPLARYGVAAGVIGMHTVEVCVAQRVADDAAVDAIDELAQRVERLLQRTSQLPGYPSAASESARTSAMFVRELGGERVYVALIKATYQRLDFE